MPYLLKITIFGLFSGLAGTGIGGLSAFLVRKASNRVIGSLLEFSAGLMTAVVCFELLPEAFKLGGSFYTFAGVLTGIGMVLLIENILIKYSRALKNSPDKGLLKAGVLMAVAIALHNFPEGFAVGSGFGASSSLGFTITAVIIIHDIPEGIAMAVPMRAGGYSKAQSFHLYSAVGRSHGAWGITRRGAWRNFGRNDIGMPRVRRRRHALYYIWRTGP
ncbi:MAG: ZIP family metal transporter [Acetivibrionales bacterium]